MPLTTRRIDSLLLVDERGRIGLLRHGRLRQHRLVARAARLREESVNVLLQGRELSRSRVHASSWGRDATQRELLLILFGQILQCNLFQIIQQFIIRRIAIRFLIITDNINEIDALKQCKLTVNLRLLNITLLYQLLRIDAAKLSKR